MVNRRREGGKGQLSAAGDAAVPLDKQTSRPTRHSSRLSLRNNTSPKSEPFSADHTDNHVYAATNGVHQPLTRRTAQKVASAEKKTDVVSTSQRSLRSRRGEVTLGQADHEAGSEEDNEELRRSSRRKDPLFHCNTSTSYDSKKDEGPESGQPDEADESADMDMYSRVKRTRRKIKRDMYGIPLVEEEEKSTEDEETEEDGNTGSESDEDNKEEDDEEDHGHNLRHRKGRSKSMNSGKYNLRRNKPRTKLYEATIERKTRHINYFKETPPERYKGSSEITFKSPAHRYRRRKKATHRTSSTSSSSSSESEDERRFSRRKKKSMAKARQRCLPMNLSTSDLTQNMKDRQRIGGSLADIDPMSVDRSVTFDSVGGLSQHIQSLKEMIVFPLLYPEVFERFKIAPPRGVLFHGPPGTGKTLVARALANECSSEEKRVAFFMRKGADCLSKWVGESERQLRLLFDQAYQVRPSIIFFDEIDGLAPVRSSRQDQIHSSIVSTLLALMDGLDSRGEVVVIGATNRIDSIDPALRRPGRFDREFLFSLPPAEARAEILKIHTKEWNPRLLDKFVLEVAAKCNGYCGADMKALCTEAALHALRRRYPQIYNCSDKLQLDVTSININAADFHHAMSKIVPAGQRAVASPGRPLSMVVRPLLLSQLNSLVHLLNSTFPFVAHQPGNAATIIDAIEDDSNTASVTECKNKRRSRPESDNVPFLDFSVAAYRTPIVNRPRLLVYGDQSQGNTHLTPALLHHMEKVPVHVLDLPTLFANSARTAEESCAQVFREARRSTPSVIYIPHIDRWWQVISHTMQTTFLIMLEDMDPLLPILLLATSFQPVRSLAKEIQELFSHTSEVYNMRDPTEAEIRSFFEDLLLRQPCVPPPCKRQAARNLLEVLPKAPVVKPALTEAEEKALWDQEENVLRELRLFLRDMLNKLASDRKFNIFSKPVDDEEVPDYYDIIKTPMDLSKMMAKIDLHQYQACREFLDDIDLICANALEYNPADSVAGRAVRHRACALKDTAHALIESELDEEFEKQCVAIMESRRSRGQTPSKSAPKYYHTKPLTTSGDSSVGQSSPVRYSRRLRKEQAAEADIHIRELTGSTARVSHDITQDDILSPPRKKRKRTRWSQGVSSVKKYKPKVVVEESEENEASAADDDNVEQQGADSAQVGSKNKQAEAGFSAAKVDLNHLLDNCENSNDPSTSSPPTNASETIGDTLVNGETTPVSSNDSSKASTPDSSDDAVLQEDGESKDAADAPCVEQTLSVATKDSDTSSQVVDKEGQVDMDTGDKPAVTDTPVQVNGALSPKPAQPQAEITASQVEACSSPIIKEKVMEMEPVHMPKRMTRSMAQDQQTLRCREMLDVPAPTFIIDSSQLPSLLDKAVSVGLRCTVTALEKLYSLLAQRVYHHRMSYNRTELLQELNGVLDSFVTDSTR